MGIWSWVGLRQESVQKSLSGEVGTDYCSQWGSKQSVRCKPDRRGFKVVEGGLASGTDCDTDVHWVLVLAQNTEVGMDARGCQVLLLVPRIKAGVDGRGCVTMGCDRTWSRSEFAKGCMTGLGTRGCQGV